VLFSTGYNVCLFQICDLGSARNLQHATKQTTVVGTYAWMAPEVCCQCKLREFQLIHHHNPVSLKSLGILVYFTFLSTYAQMLLRSEVSTACDVYSYGILLWEIITHKMPFPDVAPLVAALDAANKVSCMGGAKH